MRDIRENIDGLPEGFRFHDLRHYLASLLIAKGADIKTGAGADSPRQRQDDAGHLRPSVARCRRVHPFGDRCCNRGADGLCRIYCGLTADWSGFRYLSPQVRELAGSYIEVQRELRPAGLRVLAGIAALAYERLTCGNAPLVSWLIWAGFDVPAGGLRARAVALPNRCR